MLSDRFDTEHDVDGCVLLSTELFSNSGSVQLHRSEGSGTDGGAKGLGDEQVFGFVLDRVLRPTSREAQCE